MQGAILEMKRIKVLFVPDGAGMVKQISIPLPLLFLGVIIACLSAFFLHWCIVDYMDLSAQIPRLAQIEKEHVEKQRDFLHLSQRVDEVSKKFERLLELDRKLRSTADLGASDVETGMLAMGGSEFKTSQPGHLNTRTGGRSRLFLQRVPDLSESQPEPLIRDRGGSSGDPKSHQLLFASTPILWPAKGFIISSFGKRISPLTGKPEFHEGVDISTQLHAPALAASDGVVNSVGWQPDFGKVLSLNHGYGMATFYGHLEEVFVREGQYVRRGEKIGAASNTGSQGPRLHFEVRLYEVAVNPLLYTSDKPSLNLASVSP